MSKFKVGDVVVGNNDNGYSFTCGGSVCRVVGVANDMSICVEIVSSRNGGIGTKHWVDSDKFTLQSKASKDKTDKLPITVKGYIPRLVVMVGCKEVPAKDARKIAARMLLTIKAGKVFPCIQSYYDGEALTEQDVLNFQKWLKEQKL